ncbi:proline and serine-rich protein 2 [Sardina pilchardus]|uniref:proline and serine-rich protein 2 n=1 Tax=Sardina pilchardus TaxID=27697 RepID=UPI002E0E21B0
MPTYHCPPDLVTMDVQVQPNLHYGVNGGHESTAGTRARSTDDDTLQFLSREEKECILFFEETIDSLEESLKEEEGPALSSGNNTPVEDGSVPPSPVQTSTPVAVEPPYIRRDSDIIDLVHSTSNHTMPDFQSLAVAPEAHFENKARREPMDNFPSEYHIPVTPGEDGGGSGSGGYQPPPGSVPTPVLIAQKLAEHQGDAAAGTALLPSMLAKRRRSLDSTNPVPAAVKQGPPTSAKPANRSALLSSRDLTHDVALRAVDRRARMSPMEGGEPACVRNLPTRSVSFRDPTPDKSRMEALSKLGLVRGRAKSITPTVDPISEPTKHAPPTATVTSSSSSSSSSSSPSSSFLAPRTEIHTDFNRFGGKSTVVTPSPMPPASPDAQSSSLSPTSADVASRDFNSYGGKTIVVVPTASTSSRAVDPAPAPPPAPAPAPPPVPVPAPDSAPNYPPPAAHFSAQPAKTDPPAVELNSYGGRTKTIVPASALARADVVDGPASHPPDIRAGVPTHSPSPPATVRGEPPNTSSLSSATSVSISAASTSASHSYGGKSKVITPAPQVVPKVDPHQPEAQAAAPDHWSRTRPEVMVARENSFGSRTRVVVPGGGGGGARGKSATLPPTTAPKPPSPHRTLEAPRLPSPSKVTSKPSFRSQGITVQFSGRGVTDDSRREALRKLGLLKNGSLL